MTSQQPVANCGCKRAVQRASEWSDWGERHGRLRREGSGRAQRELPRYKKATTSLPPAVNYDYNGAIGKSDIEGKATRVGASERGKRTSFKPSVPNAQLPDIGNQKSEIGNRPSAIRHRALLLPSYFPSRRNNEGRPSENSRLPSRLTRLPTGIMIPP